MLIKQDMTFLDYFSLDSALDNCLCRK